MKQLRLSHLIYLKVYYVTWEQTFCFKIFITKTMFSLVYRFTTNNQKNCWSYSFIPFLLLTNKSFFNSTSTNASFQNRLKILNITSHPTPRTRHTPPSPQSTSTCACSSGWRQWCCAVTPVSQWGGGGREIFDTRDTGCWKVPGEKNLFWLKILCLYWLLWDGFWVFIYFLKVVRKEF